MIKNVKLIVFVVELIRQDVVESRRELYARLNLSLIRSSFFPLINRALRVTSEEDVRLCNFIHHILHFGRLCIISTHDYKLIRFVRVRRDIRVCDEEL